MPTMYAAAERRGKKPAIFYDQRGTFDELHLPQRAEGFSAYPLAATRNEKRIAQGVGRVSERMLVGLLTLLAVVTKLYRIGRRSSVSWDEAHFGKFGAKYINGMFYHDVHPPLAKMLVGLSEVLGGHNGTFDFKGGTEYPSFVNYSFMRQFNALFGIALTPMAYITCRQLRLPPAFATMAALFVTLDNAICVMSRFILLDAPLLAFTGLSALALSGLYRHRKQPFTEVWWQWLFGTGVALGLVASAKWVGMFAVALVGLFTIGELYELFCIPRLPVRLYVKHWAARIVALIVIPLCIYAMCFKIHFALLSRYDNSANFMPMGFQTKLRGNPISRQPYEIETGSAVRLQSHVSGTGYLHSHVHHYPLGSMRQQVTGYGYADANNLWNIERRAAAGTFDNAHDVSATAAPISGPIGHGDLIALHHNSTDTYLYADLGFEAPVSKQHREVSAVRAGGSEASRRNTLWRVEIVDPERRMDDGHLHPLGTPMRLHSVLGNCVLLSSGERLDKNWGWGQAEIACGSHGTLWTIERHINKKLDPIDLGRFMSSSFVRDFAVLNRQMWLTNNALIPDHDKHNVLESEPLSWPFMLYPMRMVGWDDKSIKYLEIGNPLLWWGSAFLCVLFPVQALYWLICWRRRMLAWRLPAFREYFEGAAILWTGWFLHYAPFFAMGRVTYLHHYLPALYFGILFMAYQIYHISSWYAAPRVMSSILYMAVAAVVFVFWWFSPLTYGWDQPISKLWGMEWMSTWPVYEDKLAL
ncbi:Protein O-mannosyltransferase 2 [Coemansia sp. RSA 989]|nr:Protein O-mannosyltransferase 2 [Coemansia sp. RSA 989]